MMPASDGDRPKGCLPVGQVDGIGGYELSHDEARDLRIAPARVLRSKLREGGGGAESPVGRFLFIGQDASVEFDEARRLRLEHFTQDQNLLRSCLEQSIPNHWQHVGTGLWIEYHSREGQMQSSPRIFGRCIVST